jgi:uncharacterized protein with PQ loop repeat
MLSLLGLTAAISSLTSIFVGITLQIIKNYRRKTCEGLSLTLMVSAFLAYSLWAAYGFAKRDAFLEWSQTPGSLLVFIALIQFKIYGKNRSAPRS